jgi:DNA-binding MarR family transcriptional regulator
VSPPSASRPTGDGNAFLLSQLGHRAATLFAELLTPLNLTPPLAGILRLVDRQPGMSQQELSARLRLLPSRVVAFVDELESRGYVTRERNQTDRRLHALHLTDEGRDFMAELSKVAREHDRQVTAGLNATQKADLNELLALLAEHQRLTPGVHPGFANAVAAEQGGKRRRSTRSRQA